MAFRFRKILGSRKRRYTFMSKGHRKIYNSKFIFVNALRVIRTCPWELTRTVHSFRLEEAKSRVGGCVWGNSKDADFLLTRLCQSFYIDVCLLPQEGAQRSLLKTLMIIVLIVSWPIEMQLKHLLNLKVIMKFHSLQISFILFLSVTVVVGHSEVSGESWVLFLRSQLTWFFFIFYFWLRFGT